MSQKSLICALAMLVGCEAPDPNFELYSCDDATTTHCVQVTAEEPGALMTAVNTVLDSTTIILGKGTYNYDNQVTIRGANEVALVGQGMDHTFLNFSEQEAQTNGVDVVADDFLISDLTVQDAKKDGVRIEDSDGVHIARLRVTWTNGPATENGAYGIYPVKSDNVLVEESEAYNSADAGLYVGQCQNAIIRNNYAKNNVAGIEIENTQYADVYGNIAEANNGGLLIFDLPGNPVIGRDIRIHDNIVRNNNLPNFAKGGTVASIPAGTGTVVLASRRVELFNNTYENNDTGDIAILNGLAIEGKESSWALNPAELVGDYEDLNLVTDGESVFNFRTEEIHVYDNTFSGSGTNADYSSVDDRPIGFILWAVYGDTTVDNILYDAIMESSFSPTDPAANSNDNHICVGESGEGTFASLDLETLGGRAANFDFGTVDDLFRPPAPFTPFDCDGLTLGPVADVELSF